MGQCPSTFSAKSNPSMKIKEQTIPFHAASVGEDEARAAADVIRSGWLTMGPKTIEFERNFASYVGARHAIGVSSCTAALHLALEAVGLLQGDEVLVPTTTFTATAEVVVYFKAIPVLVDVDPITLCIDPEEARKKNNKQDPRHSAGPFCRTALRYGQNSTSRRRPQSPRNRRRGTFASSFLSRHARRRHQQTNSVQLLCDQDPHHRGRRYGHYR